LCSLQFRHCGFKRKHYSLKIDLIKKVYTSMLGEITATLFQVMNDSIESTKSCDEMAFTKVGRFPECGK
jgi:hypothetical protein